MQTSKQDKHRHLSPFNWIYSLNNVLKGDKQVIFYNSCNGLIACSLKKITNCRKSSQIQYTSRK